MKEENNQTLKRLISEEVRKQLKGGLFTARKLTDTPTDALQVANRKYVDLNGDTSQRPSAPFMGQHYFDTDLGYPIWWDGSNWVDAQGNTV